jgi:hypothetical protein
VRCINGRTTNVAFWPIATLSFEITTAFTPERTVGQPPSPGPIQGLSNKRTPGRINLRGFSLRSLYVLLCGLLQSCRPTFKFSDNREHLRVNERSFALLYEADPFIQMDD